MPEVALELKRVWHPCTKPFVSHDGFNTFRSVTITQYWCSADVSGFVWARTHPSPRQNPRFKPLFEI